MNYLGRHKFMLGLVGVLTAVSALANLLGTYMIKPVVNGILETGSIPGLVRGAVSYTHLAVIGSVRPDEIYNLAAQSHVQVSFDVPEFTADVDATGVLRVLEAVRLCGLADTCRVYQASTSELYGKVEDCLLYTSRCV